MASDWLAAVLPANQMPGLKIFVNLHGFQHGNFLVTQAPGAQRTPKGHWQVLKTDFA